MNEITLVAVFYNEEKKLPGYFENVRGTVDRMVVVDCTSGDATAAICKRNGAEVVESPFHYFEQNVNRAFAKVKQGDWVLVLDADERLSEELKKEMKEAVKSGETDIYYIRRINYLFDGFSTKSTINTSLPRLFRKGCVRWEQEMPHEKPVAEGRKGKLDSLFFHYAYMNMPDYVDKMRDYLCRMPAEFAKKGKKSILIGERDSKVSLVFGAHGMRRLFIYPPVLILSHLFARRLVLDGMRGILFAICAGAYAFFEEAIYYEMKSKERQGIVIDWSREYPDK